MLTSMTLQNFKGIGEEIIIPLRPITLLFGANSSGKSTILQAIHYAREILERRNINADKTLHGGDIIDLGGFLNLLHNHDSQKTMLLRFELDLSDISLPYYSDAEMRDVDYLEYQLDVSAKTAVIELKIEWSSILHLPVVRSYETQINGLPIARLLTGSDKVECSLEVYRAHPLLRLESDVVVSTDIEWLQLSSSNLSPQIPTWQEQLHFNQLPEEFFHVSSNEAFNLIVTQVLTGPGEVLLAELQRFRYLGPMRSIPSRVYYPAFTADEKNWANGLAAWDTLYNSETGLRDDVSEWMTDEKKLNTGYGIQLREFRELSIDNPLLLALQNNTLFDDVDVDRVRQEYARTPTGKRLELVDHNKGLRVLPQDVGVGISQVLPVVVAALETHNGILAIEQPELHLHPAIQARLGDLFIESALGNRKNLLLLETHSEHLILRLLRRIRETNEEGLPTEALQIKPDDLQVLYLKSEAGMTKVFSLPITPDGDFAVKWPDGFFEERAEEIF